MKTERFTAVVFIFVIMAFMVMAFYSAGARTKDLMEEPQREIKIEWDKIYPFEDSDNDTRAQDDSSWYGYIKGRFEDYTSKKLPGYYKMVETAKKYEDALAWNMVSVFDYNAVIKLKDGYLTSYTPSRDVSHNAEGLKSLADLCAEKKIDFMYINFPSKICVSDDRDICGTLDFSNENADKLLAMLKEYGIRTYDFRKNFHSAGMKHHESFFVTDLHWKPETGLWAAGEILKILRDDLKWDVDPGTLKPENFSRKIYPELFLGAEGKKLTLSRAKPEDFTLIYPKFAARLKFEVPSLMLNLSGDFGITYDMTQLEPRDYYEKNAYSAYIYANNPISLIENLNSRNGKRLVVVKDSFSDCVVQFAALEVQYVVVVDLRYFTGSLRNFIGTVNPDAVIVVYYSAVPGRTDELDKKFWDFR